MNIRRIVLADDQLLVRAGIRALIETLPGYTIEAECADGLEAITQVDMQLPDILLLDIAMPGPSGIEVANLLRAKYPELRILILSSIEQPTIIEQALAAGVNGYLHKDFILDELQEALNAVLSGNCFLSPNIRLLAASTAGNAPTTPGLTTRQKEILCLVASGLSTKEIARQLSISPKTVEFHRSRLMERIGVHDVTGLTRYALQNGMIH